MIQHLTIQNLALIEQTEISFEKGLNIITGETGAGKTLVLTALGLVLGRRAQTNMVRQGAEKTVIEATFDFPEIAEVLCEAEIEHDAQDLLVIRREISKEGRSRTQINGQTVPLPLLQKITSALCTLVDQSTQHELKEPETQLNFLDLYADLQEQVKQFAISWEKERATQAKLQALLEQNTRREQESEFAAFQLQELQTAALHEEESCFAEYQLLCKRHEALEKVHTLHAALSDSPQALLSQISRLRSNLESVARLDPLLEEVPTLLQEALIPLNEIGALLSQSLEQKEADPKRLQHLEERLSKMHALKRKIHKNTLEEISAYEEELKARLQMWDSLEQDIATLQAELQTLQADTQTIANELTAKRKACAKKWQAEITKAVRELNMPQAELHIEVEKSERTQSGDDRVIFWIKANQGEALIPLQSSASGGELSRILLVLCTTLAAKNRTPLLIFDEIDANVGGETATQIGQKLRELAEFRQVLCITHFPQVARFADHHLGIQKNSSDERTITTIQALSKQARERELLRMSGG